MLTDSYTSSFIPLTVVMHVALKHKWQSGKGQVQVEPSGSTRHSFTSGVHPLKESKAEGDLLEAGIPDRT